MTTHSKPPRRARRSSGAITLHDVAQLANVAPITASRALNSPTKVSAEILKRVLEAVARTGYVPNRLAGGLASTKSRLVAALVPTISGPVFLETIQSLTEALGEAGYQLMLGQSGYPNLHEDALLEAIIGRRPDGIVLTGIMRSTEGRKRLLACGIPIVETWDLTTRPLDMLVGFSHVDVGHAVAEFLIAKGRKRLAVVSADDERATRRLEAFEARAAALGVAKIRRAIVPAPTTLRLGRSAMAELLSKGRPPNAIFCSSDLLALGVMIEAQSRGLSIPRDLALVGFGDLDFAADLNPSLTTVRVDGKAIGRQAARFVTDRSEGRSSGMRIVDVGFAIVERATT
jgi:LacI family gluconate utilization system Gnt-I transcriptional repressor